MMRFSVGVDYSVKALLMLAEHYQSALPVRVEEIAAARGIPENYLRRLLIQLKRTGLVVSQKGPNGGYLLARQPAEITVEEIVQAVEGDYIPAEAMEEPLKSPRKRGQISPMRAVWQEIQESVLGILRRTTIQTLAESQRTSLHYQI